jgi:hypothetical protein
LTLIALALASWGRDEIKTYRVAKEDSAATPPDQVVAPDQNSTTQPQLQWTLPNGWQKKNSGPDAPSVATSSRVGHSSA